MKFVGIVFISSSYDFITSSEIIAESSIILSKLQTTNYKLQLAGFQT